MAEQNASESSSFTRAFLPGLILGIVVGGLAGAYLPELLSPPGTTGTHSEHSTGGEPTGTFGQPRDDEFRGVIDETQEALDDAADDAGAAVDGAIDEAGEQVPAVSDPADGG